MTTGCATWSQHGVNPGQDLKFRIAVAPIIDSAEVDKLSDIQTLVDEAVVDGKRVQSQMQNVTKQLEILLKHKLEESEYLELVPIHIQAVDAGQFEMNAETIQKIKAKYNVQAVLVVTLSGYGKIKRKWLTYLIATGVVEGVVQGYVAAKLVDNTWVGLVVALEEIGQEVLVWGGGSRLFNKYYSPVTLEARLISTTDAQAIWDDTIFASVDSDAIEKLPEQDRDKRELHLQLTAKKAINELIEELNDKARHNLNIENEVPDETDMLFE